MRDNKCFVQTLGDARAWARVPDWFRSRVPEPPSLLGRKPCVRHQRVLARQFVRLGGGQRGVHLGRQHRLLLVEMF